MLSKTVEYALRSIIYVALNESSGKKAGIKEIARELDLPVHFIGKILQRVVKHNLLASIKGPNGGFYLSKKPEEISIMDVIRVIDGVEAFKKCGLGLKDCSDIHPCPLHEDFKKYRDGLKEVFLKKTIRELVHEILAGRGYISNVKIDAA